MKKEQILELNNYFENIFKEMLREEKHWIKSKKYISTHFKFPIKHKNFDNEMPSFSESLLLDNTPKDYGSIFTLHQNEKDKIYMRNLKNFEYLSSYVKDDEYLHKKLNPLKHEEYEDFYLYYIFTNLIDRYIHLYGEESRFTKKRYLGIIYKFLNFIYFENASLEIYIPILFINFGFDKYIIDENTEITKMDDNFQLSRQEITNYGSGVHKTVLGCATHCLKIKNYNCDYKGILDLESTLSNINSYPLNKIDNFFGALRICNKVDVGYCQLITKLIDVGIRDGIEKLQKLYGTSLRAYPSKFDDYYWNTEIPTLTKKQIDEVKLVYLKMLENTDKKVELSIDRINRSFTRSNLEDAFLDNLIGLESILTSSAKESIKYRLTLHTAYILSCADQTTNNIRKIISKIYEYRSMIVHGDKSKNKKRYIEIENIKYDCQELAKDYFCEILKFILLNYDGSIIKDLDNYLDNEIFKEISNLTPKE